MRILIVCGAGASSTFVAQRLRTAATAAGFPLHTAAGTQQSIIGAGADLILVGPHLADELPAIRSSVEVPVVALPEDIFRDHDGTRTLGIVRTALADAASAETKKGTS